jgi:signal transduction histidine kinase
MVESDRRMLSQILLNLAGNAIKFTERGGVAITIELLSDGSDCVRFAVRDTGIGIDAGARTRVFGAFEQIVGQAKPRQPGTGLGLHISQRLAVLLGGHVDFVSEPGTGSTFWLDLPREVAWEAAA